jgi:hypothetical protein
MFGDGPGKYNDRCRRNLHLHLLASTFWKHHGANDIARHRHNKFFEKSHIRATDPALCAGMTTVSPREHFRISSEAFASLSKKPADTGRQ